MYGTHPKKIQITLKNSFVSKNLIIKIKDLDFVGIYNLRLFSTTCINSPHLSFISMPY